MKKLNCIWVLMIFIGSDCTASSGVSVGEQEDNEESIKQL